MHYVRPSNCGSAHLSPAPGVEVEEKCKIIIGHNTPQIPTPGLTIHILLTKTLDDELVPLLIYDNDLDGRSRVIAFATKTATEDHATKDDANVFDRTELLVIFDLAVVCLHSVMNVTTRATKLLS
ncbi:hypothetical protein CHS0354_036312 [Potamilus streckersoni]|uniref:Uncharacterized protein n=1 Tax=Potamilus streckersoni TaxID=2493646 RepID=A0AAE0W9H3_9BIVA|nr:hypothetical protein CHS0354_036312 [Potamilus streckersoni]